MDIKTGSYLNRAVQKPTVTSSANSEGPTHPLISQAVDSFQAASESVDKKPWLANVLTAGSAVARSFKAFPGFVYPSVNHASEVERAQIMDVLDSLPLHQVNDVKAITMVAEIANPKPGYVTNGRAFDISLTNHVELSRKELWNSEKLRGTLTHEIGHTVDYESQTLNLFGERSASKPFGEGPHITDYATTNHREDFAESFEEFHIRPDNLKQKAPEKYEAMEELAKPTWLQSLVDRQEFRETGKYIAKTIGPNSASRHVVQGVYFASSALQFGHGISQWSRSLDSGDSLGHASGILNTASAGLMMSGLNPLVGMAVQGANFALNGAVRRGKLSPEEVESAVALPVRPLEAAFKREKVTIEDEHRTGKVAAVAVGGAVGGAVGAIAGPYLGVMAGYHLAGGLGGSIGMVAGGLLGFVGGAGLGGRAAGAVADLVSPEVQPFQYAS